MEFLWKSYGLGASRGIFTTILFQHYSLPDFLKYNDDERCYNTLPANATEIESW